MILFSWPPWNLNLIRYGMANVKSRILLLRIKKLRHYFPALFFICKALPCPLMHCCNKRRYFPYTEKNSDSLLSVPRKDVLISRSYVATVGELIKQKGFEVAKSAFMLFLDGSTKTCKFANYTFKSNEKFNI